MSGCGPGREEEAAWAGSLLERTAALCSATAWEPGSGLCVKVFTQIITTFWQEIRKIKIHDIELVLIVCL